MTSVWSLVLVVVVVVFVGAGAATKPSGYLVHVSDVHYDPLYANDDVTTNCRAAASPRRGVERIKFADDLSFEEKERQKRAAEMGSRLLKERKQKRNSGEDSSSPYGIYGCDSPISLVDATMDELKTVAPNPDWVFVTGDYAAHGLTGVGNYTYEAMENVTLSLEAVYPQSNIYFCFGNNDVPERNYEVDCSSRWFSDIYDLWEDYIPADQKETFLQMGAYRVNLSFTFPPPDTPQPSPLWLLVMNTLFYSTRSNHKDEFDPCGQFEWLEDQLLEAQKEGAQVYLMSHIMPGIDSYNFVSLWEERFNTQFFDVVTPYTDVIVGQFYGHVHSDEYRAYDDIPPSPKKVAPLVFNGLVNSAVSPIYGNNPNFRVASYSQKNFSVIDYKIWSMDLEKSNEEQKPSWSTLYSFEDAYDVGSPDKSGIETLNSKIINDYPTFSLWYQHRSSGSSGDYAPEKGSLAWGCLICAMDSEEVVEFEECLVNLDISGDCGTVH